MVAGANFKPTFEKFDWKKVSRSQSLFFHLITYVSKRYICFPVALKTIFLKQNGEKNVHSGHLFQDFISSCKGNSLILQ